MPFSAEVIPYRGWPRALRIANGDAELVATLDIGPRILAYALDGGPNVFAVYDEQAGGVGEPQWKNRGGHRLWLAPEDSVLSYFPDNRPVAWSRAGRTVRLTPPAEESTGFQKEMEVTLDETGSGVRVLHRLTRTGSEPRRVAPWALSVMAPGGCAILPQPPFGEHPRDLLPNRRVVLWPYTDLADARYRFGRRFHVLRQVAEAPPTKIGLALREGWAGYLRDGTLFLKRFGWDSGAEYPDDGCNCEVFTNRRMLELESLGPLQTLEQGQSAEWTERWELQGGVPAGAAEDDESLATALSEARTRSSAGGPD